MPHPEATNEPRRGDQRVLFSTSNTKAEPQQLKKQNKTVSGLILKLL